MQSVVIAQANQNTDFLVGLALVVGAFVAAIAVRVQRRKATVQRAKENRPFIRPTHPVVDAPLTATAMPQGSPIDVVRALVGPAPRRFQPSLSSYLRVEPPSWLRASRNDDDWINIKRQEYLRRNGIVVWATIVQANKYLFQPTNAETGASVIYSPDTWFDRHRETLRALASQCIALKGTDPSDLESAAFARMLTNELTRAMGMKVPRLFTGGRAVYHSSMLMPRKHLPKGVLTGTYFPVWIDPEKIGPVIMVPAAYWPASLTAEWDS
jgi:hypothetical protein